MNATIIMDIGQRDTQQDSAFLGDSVFQEKHLFSTIKLQESFLATIADGVGGLPHGDIASLIACTIAQSSTPPHRNIELWMRSLFLNIHSKIIDTRTGGATTLASIAKNKNEYCFAICGDAFILFISEYGIYTPYNNKAVTIESSNILKQKKIFPHITAHCLGSLQAHPHVTTERLHAADIAKLSIKKIILCTDGAFFPLLNMPRQALLAPTSASHKTLIYLKSSKIEDNYTAIVIDT